MVHLGILRVLRVGICLRLPAGSLAVRTRRSHLVSSRTPAMVARTFKVALHRRPLRNKSRRRYPSKVYPQRQLSCTIASGALGQRRLQNPERWASDVHRGWRKVGVIEHVCERRFEAEVHLLPEVEALGETHVHVYHVWTLQNSHTAAPKPSGIGWGQGEGVRIVKLLSGLPRGRVSHAIRPRNGPSSASHDHIGV